MNHRELLEKLEKKKNNEELEKCFTHTFFNTEKGSKSALETTTCPNRAKSPLRSKKRKKKNKNN